MIFVLMQALLDLTHFLARQFQTYANIKNQKRNNHIF